MNKEEKKNIESEKKFLKLIDEKITYKPNFELIRNRIQYDEEPSLSSKKFFSRLSFKLTFGISSLCLVLIVSILVIVGINLNNKDSGEPILDKMIVGGKIEYENGLYYVSSEATLEFIGVDSEVNEFVIPDEIEKHLVTKLSSISSEKLNSLCIPSTIEYIDVEKIDCPNLQNIVIEEDNKVYDSRDNCNAIIESSTSKLIKGFGNTIIPSSIKTIATHAFFRSTIGNLDVPTGVKIIEKEAFLECNDLRTINISSTVGLIGENAFSNCTNINSINVSDSNRYYDSRNNCNAICEKKTNTLILGCYNSEIPDNIEKIGKNAFAYCLRLEQISIPSSVKVIDTCAFYYCKYLNSVTLEQGINEIVYGAFYNCDNLYVIDYNGSVSDLEKIKYGVLNISNDLEIVCTKEA